MLFKTTKELIQYAEGTTNLNMDSLRPSIVSSEMAYIIPYLGRALYAALNTAYNASTPFTTPPALASLLPVVQQALAPYVLYTFAPKSEVTFTDGGLRRLETGNAKTAYQNQVINARLQLRADGELHTESLIAFLEENSTDYPLWTNSAEFKDYRSLFVKTSSEFNRLFSTASPGRNYLLMRSTMAEVENQHIKKLLGKSFFNILKTKDAELVPDFTDEETDLIKLLKPFIAYLTLVKAIPLLNVKIDERGLTVYASGSMATRDDDSKREAANKDQINHLLDELKASAANALAEVELYLLETASTTIFPEFYTYKHPAHQVKTICSPQTPGGAYGLT